MAFSFFLRLALKSLHHFAWPLLSLGYPMCASVQAIETDSYEETRDLISYWILLSLLYLFEYAFINLLLWFQFWPYIKLIVIFWLVVPDFRRASYVYNSLISFIKPRIVACNLSNYWRNVFVEKENFLLQAERYVKDNGTEALEKLIASKVNSYGVVSVYKPDAEATNAVRATHNIEMQQIKGKILQTEQEGTKVLEVIEKKEISASKKNVPVMPIAVPSQNASSAIVETIGITTGITGKDTASAELCQSSASTHKEVQKEWTCALCQVTVSSEITLNSHLKGRKHGIAFEALKAQKQSTQQKPRISKCKEELKQKNVTNHQNSKANNAAKGTLVIDHNVQKLQQSSSKGTLVMDPKVEKPQQSSSKGILFVDPNGKVHKPQQNWSKGILVMDHKVQKPQQNLSELVRMKKSKFKCVVCDVILESESSVASHFNGKKHLANIQS